MFQNLRGQVLDLIWLKYLTRTNVLSQVTVNSFYQFSLVNLCGNAYAIQGKIAVIIFSANGALSAMLDEFGKQKGL